jgi:hypothetical protein
LDDQAPVNILTNENSVKLPKSFVAINITEVSPQLFGPIRKSSTASLERPEYLADQTETSETVPESAIQDDEPMEEVIGKLDEELDASKNGFKPGETSTGNHEAN